jgi:hypothetical protein
MPRNEHEARLLVTIWLVTFTLGLLLALWLELYYFRKR